MNKIKLYLLNVNKTKRVKSAYLYGSYARGAANDWSDIDLAIISPDFGDMFEERLELMRLAVSMDDRIEPHPFRPEEFNDNQPLASEIRRTGIAIDIQTSR
jgi:predicted nucleotidyltransferase